VIDALAVERATMAAWPAGETEEHDGWFHLAASGVTGRVNAVWPLEWRGRDLESAIDRAEQWYAERRLAPRFKLTDGAFAPLDLPQRLARRNYAPTMPTLIMIRTLAGALKPKVHQVELFDTMPEAFDRALRESTPDPEELDERRAIALRAPTPTAFAVRAESDAPVAVGMSACAGDVAGLFLMRTVPEARRQGHARHVLHALVDWAARQGARTIFLQVDAHNTPAVALYEREGFETLTAYRFWRKAP